MTLLKMGVLTFHYLERMKPLSNHRSSEVTRDSWNMLSPWECISLHDKPLSFSSPYYSQAMWNGLWEPAQTAQNRLTVQQIFKLKKCREDEGTIWGTYRACIALCMNVCTFNLCPVRCTLGNTWTACKQVITHSNFTQQTVFNILHHTDRSRRKLKTQSNIVTAKEILAD